MGWKGGDSDVLYAIHPNLAFPIRGFPYIIGQFEMLIVPAHCSARFVPVNSFHATQGFASHAGNVTGTMWC